MRSFKLTTIALLSMTLIGLELVWTRIFSAEFFYTFAFLVLSLAILGLGLGGLALRFFPFLNQEDRLDVWLALSGLGALVGPPLVFALDVNFSELFRSSAMVGKLVVALVLLAAPYFFGGIALAFLFRRYHGEMARLYMADLLGAGGGVLFVIWLMTRFGTPGAVFLCAVPILAAAVLAGRGPRRAVPAALCAAAVAFAFDADRLLEKKREESAPVIYKHWDAMAKIKVFEYPEGGRRINIDNAANSPVYPFDGNWNRPDDEKFEFGIDVSYLIGMFPRCTFLSLGAGGGVDVLQALQAGAAQVHAVEVVPHINELMTAGMLADYSGRIYSDPRVTVATEDARVYVGRFERKFDVIYSLSSNSFAALASGAFALAENYLFTTEAFTAYWRAMSDDGFLVMEHQFYMPRLVSEVKDALARQGVSDPPAHFAVYDLPQMRRNVLILSKRPLDDELRRCALGELTPENFPRIHLLFPAPPGLEDNLINRIALEGWKRLQPEAAIDLSPATDDRPYVAQLGMWKNLRRGTPGTISPYEFSGFPLSKLLIAVILTVIAAVVLPLNALPYLLKGPRLRLAPWLYFFVIGAAFMMVEVVLIQQYTLFIGSGVVSLIVILVTLLLACGVGSRFAERVDSRIAFAVIVLWLAADALWFPRMAASLGDLPLFHRVLVTVAALLPVGFFMGMPFPRAALRVREGIDWGYAVNGAASVLGSTLVILVSLRFGFTASLLAAAGLYAAAGFLLRRESAWV